jgi:hypothetical protein
LAHSQAGCTYTTPAPFNYNEPIKTHISNESEPSHGIPGYYLLVHGTGWYTIEMSEILQFDPSNDAPVTDKRSAV